MRAAVFVEPGRIVLEQTSVPDVGPVDALIRITTTTICGTDVHILEGEYLVRPAVAGYREGRRVIAGAITPAGYELCSHQRDGVLEVAITP